MKKEILKQDINPILGIESSNREDFTEIHSIVENLLEAINEKKNGKVKKRKLGTRKKWKKPVQKKKSLEDLGIRNLPFTF